MAAQHDDRITDEEHQRRRWIIDQARHSTEMEGGRSSDEARALQEQSVRGEFDADELVRRGRVLHGLDPEP